MCWERSFQVRVAAPGNAWSPAVERRVLWTINDDEMTWLIIEVDSCQSSLSGGVRQRNRRQSLRVVSKWLVTIMPFNNRKLNSVPPYGAPPKLPLPLVIVLPRRRRTYGDRQHAQKIGKDRTCGSGDVLADRQTDRHTHTDTQTRSLQYFATAG